MDWFRDLKIEFTLHRDVLSAHIEVEMKKSKPAAAGGGFAFPGILPKPKQAEPEPRKPAKPVPEGGR